MGKLTGSDREHPTLGPFAATLDDGELARLGADHDHAAAHCQVRATSCYGEGVRLADGRTWPAAIEGAARRIAPRAPTLVA